MKRNFFTLTAIVLAIALIPGCQKGNEYKINHGAAELKDCPITQIINSSQFSDDTLIFTYNFWGDPVSITKLPWPRTGSPNYVFHYDKKRRLTEIIGLYGYATGAEEWHKYFYDNTGNSNITRDSLYGFVTINNGVMTNYMYSALTYYTYDKYDRIIKDSTPGYPPYVQTYVYDQNGNRVGRTYDNKVNMHRTNKIWMFYDRDYSVNNAFFAESYNSAGLPTRVIDPNKYPNMRFMKEPFIIAQITYGCR